MRPPGFAAPPGLGPPAAEIAYVQAPSATGAGENLFLEHENFRLARENALLRQCCLQADISAVAASQLAGAFMHQPPDTAAPGFSSRGPAPAKQVKASAGKAASSKAKSQPPKEVAPKADAVASRGKPMAFRLEPRPAHCETQSGGDEPGATDGRTTVMLRNLPNNLTRAMLRELFDLQGFASYYDFLYLPIDFKSQANLGYAFLNLVSEDHVAPFWKHFNGFTGWARASQKVCSVLWSSPHQGLEVHIERNRNNPVMHEDVPESHKPLLLKNGEEIPFPPPTRKLRAPRIRVSRAAGAAPQRPTPSEDAPGPLPRFLPSERPTPSEDAPVSTGA